ncbi:MAG: hypothetical protein GEU93_07725 [Propionibacteriales bacterium]|nr:hypothetical protein [Propionibacteriales bacterium]
MAGVAKRWLVLVLLAVTGVAFGAVAGFMAGLLRPRPGPRPEGGAGSRRCRRMGEHARRPGRES